ncbi:hypothetical protein THAOC_02212 [Thalassiosira oceanica]|uniref:Uncharacterized protein n=1 Tax=Thalassiosira oceanica TaxID=159749 RepID=K0TB90_THAOC|nr:hypothetical protein THAOC_02212 [Thalassiosira oceanica]|eukprot:EJK76043.1 hypothetical protein THAOC_02212 [Thalassiosira oceanica]
MEEDEETSTLQPNAEGGAICERNADVGVYRVCELSRPKPRHVDTPVWESLLNWLCFESPCSDDFPTNRRVHADPIVETSEELASRLQQFIEEEDHDANITRLLARAAEHKAGGPEQKHNSHQHNKSRHEHAAAVIGTSREVILRPVWISELEGGIRELSVESEGSIDACNDTAEEQKSSAELETLFEHQNRSRAWSWRLCLSIRTEVKRGAGDFVRASKDCWRWRTGVERGEQESSELDGAPTVERVETEAKTSQGPSHYGSKKERFTEDGDSETSYEFIYEQFDGAPTIDRVEMVEKASLEMYRPIWTVLMDALVLANLFGGGRYIHADRERETAARQGREEAKEGAATDARLREEVEGDHGQDACQDGGGAAARGAAQEREEETGRPASRGGPHEGAAKDSHCRGPGGHRAAKDERAVRAGAQDPQTEAIAGEGGEAKSKGGGGPKVRRSRFSGAGYRTELSCLTLAAYSPHVLRQDKEARRAQEADSGPARAAAQGNRGKAEGSREEGARAGGKDRAEKADGPAAKQREEEKRNLLLRKQQSHEAFLHEIERQKEDDMVFRRQRSKAIDQRRRSQLQKSRRCEEEKKQQARAKLQHEEETIAKLRDERAKEAALVKAERDLQLQMKRDNLDRIKRANEYRLRETERKAEANNRRAMELKAKKEELLRARQRNAAQARVEKDKLLRVLDDAGSSSTQIKKLLRSLET